MTYKKPLVASDQLAILRLRSLCDDKIHLKAHIDWLLNRLKCGDTARLHALCSLYGSMFSCVVYMNRGHIVPSAGLTAEQCKALARLNAELDIDILA